MPRLDGNPSDAHSGHGDNINGSFSLTLDRRGEKKKTSSGYGNPASLKLPVSKGTQKPSKPLDAASAHTHTPTGKKQQPRNLEVRPTSRGLTLGLARATTKKFCSQTMVDAWYLRTTRKRRTEWYNLTLRVRVHQLTTKRRSALPQPRPCASLRRPAPQPPRGQQRNHLSWTSREGVLEASRG